MKETIALSDLPQVQPQINPRQLKKLLSMIREVRKVAPYIHIQTLQLYLEIASDQGVSGTELRKRTRLKPASYSRNLSILNGVNYRRGEGMNLVASTVSPRSRRNKVHSLSPDGLQLAIRLSSV